MWPQLKSGVTRKVLVFKHIVIKFPNPTYSHRHFLQGCFFNWSERNYYKQFNYSSSLRHHVAPSYFCCFFGLFQIQARCSPKLEELTPEEKEFYSPLCGTDTKKENFGYYQGRLVCLDYPEQT